MSQALGIPRNYLSKILHALTRGGQLESTRGPRGGFTLARDPASIVLTDIIDQFDDISGTSRCLLGRPQCSDGDPCPVHWRWKELSGSMVAFFQDTTVLMESAEAGPSPVVDEEPSSVTGPNRVVPPSNSRRS
jgi:Rrf2 family iron-sulfur cluster assembly transcriptional regulator